MKIKFENGVKKGEEIELTPLGLSLGRETDNDVHLLVDGVSRYHAKIEQIGNNWIIKDLGSTNGVEINGKDIPTSQVLTEGDIVSVGDQKFLFGEKKAAVMTPDPLPADSAPSNATIAMPKPEPIPDTSISSKSESDSNLEELKLFDNEKNAENNNSNKDNTALKKFLVNFIFYIVLIAIAGVAIVMFLPKKKKDNKKEVVKTENKIDLLTVLYEKEVIEDDNIFRCSILIEQSKTSSIAKISLSELKSKRNFESPPIAIEKQDIINDLKTAITESKFMSLSPRHSLIADAEKEYYKKIMVILDNKLQIIEIKNETAPNSFIEVETLINNFSSEHLNISFFMTEDDTLKAGKEAFMRAEDLYSNYQADPSNLTKSIKWYKKSENLLKQFPYESEELIIGRRHNKEAAALKKKKIEEFTFNAVQANGFKHLDDVIKWHKKIIKLVEFGSNQYKISIHVINGANQRLRKQGRK